MVWIGGNGGVRGGGVGGGSVGGKVGDGGGRVHNGGIGGDGIGVGKGGVGRQPAPRCEHESEQLWLSQIDLLNSKQAPNAR